MWNMCWSRGENFAEFLDLVQEARTDPNMMDQLEKIDATVSELNGKFAKDVHVKQCRGV